VVATGAGSAAVAGKTLLPRDGAPAQGIRVAGEPIPDGAPVADHVARLCARFESRPIGVVVPGRRSPLQVPLRKLGVRLEPEPIAARAMAVGRRGPIEQRLDEAWRARAGEIDVPLAWRIEAATLLAALSDIKEELDEPPVPAKLDLARRAVVPHRNGRYLDLMATLDQLERLVRVGASELRVPVTQVAPIASSELLESIDISQTVGRFETRFGYLGHEASRAGNIATAAGRFDGVVLLPAQVVSFNDTVGHRTLDNGFGKAWEIFKGEMVEGVGGGTCQVASTLHAAAYLGGLDIVERSPHSRPSGYITMGLDATVVDGAVDLKLRNPFPFPIVVHALVKKRKLAFELLGRERAAAVTFQRDVVAMRTYRRDVRETSWLAAGSVVRKQHGIPGYTVRRTRTSRLRDGTERVDETLDVYPPTTEIYLVPPGTDAEAVLPPLPSEGGRAASAPVATPAPGPCAGGCPAPAEIRDAPGAHAPTPEQSRAPRTLVIGR
jgi:vancomycin resistance protein YoaR